MKQHVGDSLVTFYFFKYSYKNPENKQTNTGSVYTRIFSGWPRMGREKAFPFAFFFFIDSTKFMSMFPNNNT